jgi:hypothetical protein
MKKSTIYIDIEDDIASIIEKVESAEQKIVAMVLPKRPSVLQSSVNIRLLKQSSDEESKSVVLITTDEQVSRLAGEVGMHISGSLQSKPFIPGAQTKEPESTVEINDDGGDDTGSDQPDVYVDDKKIDLKTPIGDLVPADNTADIDEDDSIDLDDEPASEEQSQGDDELDTKEKSTKQAKKIKVPNFGKFGSKMSLGIVGIVAIILAGFWAMVIAPRAKITISTEKSSVSTKVSLTASKDQKTVDLEKSLVPADRKEDIQKLSGTFQATGKKDVGEKASGTVTFKNCEDSTSITIPSGTGVSKGAYTFITQKSVTLSGGTFSGGGSVCTSSSSEPVTVIASANGDQFNVAAGSYTVAGNYGKIAALGSAMGGGTSKTVKIVSDEDIDTAKTKLLATAADNVKGKLSQLLTAASLIPVPDTFVTNQGAATSSIASGAEAPGDVTVSLDVTSSMLGIKLSDVDQLVAKELTKKINPVTQKVYSTNTTKAVISINDRPNNDSAVITVASDATVGPLLDKVALAKEIAGKKAGVAKQQISAKPGVSNVDVRLSPFWVFSIPKNTKHVTLVVNE